MTSCAFHIDKTKDLSSIHSLILWLASPVNVQGKFCFTAEKIEFFRDKYKYIIAFQQLDDDENILRGGGGGGGVTRATLSPQILAPVLRAPKGPQAPTYANHPSLLPSLVAECRAFGLQHSLKAHNSTKSLTSLSGINYKIGRREPVLASILKKKNTTLCVKIRTLRRQLFEI